MKLMIMLLISLLLATGVEAGKKNAKCKTWHVDSLKDSLKAAVKAFNKKPAKAEKQYGPIAGWDVSGITDMSYLFSYLSDFNADISNWNTSGVTNMRDMFDVRSPARALLPEPPSSGSSA